MTWSIGADHRGFAHKEAIKKFFADITWHDAGAYDTNRSDYPVFAHGVCHEILSGRAHGGILICGTGVGMAITANRYPGIYAGLVWNEDVARLAREHDNANILVIPSDFVSIDLAITLVRIWSQAQFLEGQYRQRLELIDTGL